MSQTLPFDTATTTRKPDVDLRTAESPNLLGDLRRSLHLACSGLTGEAGRAYLARLALMLVADLLLTTAALGLGVPTPVALVVSFMAAVLIAQTASLYLGLQSPLADGPTLGWLLRMVLLGALTLALRGGAVLTVVNGMGGPQWLGLAAGALVTVVTWGIGMPTLVHPAAMSAADSWRLRILGVVVYLLALRLLFMGAIDLLPEEAYYWMYARHVDIGYLDHPPMASWLIWLGTHLVGVNEFGVRLPAVLTWAVATVFMYRLATNLYSRQAGWLVIGMMATLPIYFGTGMILTPDAPLYACWAGSLYFLERVLLGRKTWGWWGAGLCLGLGMLSKYSIALLGPSIVLFICLDPASRRWLRRPEPYLAAFLGLAVFSPVIIWNWQHDWASFTFQGSRRWSGRHSFNLHRTIGAILVLLTPLGAAAVVQVLRRGVLRDPRRLFALVFTCLPLSVFLLHSLQGKPKLNWTGPLWFAVLPLLAASIVHAMQRAQADGSRAHWTLRHWRAAFMIMPLAYAGAMYYLLLGAPGLPLNEMQWPVAWEEMAEPVEEVEQATTRQTGRQPLVAGMDKYNIAAAYAFYGRGAAPVDDVYGRHLWGRNSLMWAQWGPMERAVGRDIVMVGFEPEKLDDARLGHSFASVGPIEAHAVVKDGRVVSRIYTRVGHDFRPDPALLADDDG